MVMHILRSKKVAKRVLLGLLIVIIPAFVLWGAGSFLNQPEYVGKIGGKKINTDDFSKSIQGIRAQILLSHYGNFKALNALLQNRELINQMAWERLIMLDAAKRKRINISDRDLLGFLTVHPLFKRGGSFSRDSYEMLVRNNLGMETRSFEELVRENLMVNLFRRSLFKDLDISDAEVLEYYKRNNDSVSISYIYLSKDDFSGGIEVTLEEAQEYFNNNKGVFISPEQIDVEYITVPFANATEKDQAIEIVKKVYPELLKSPGSFRKIAESNNLRYTQTGLFSRRDLVPGMENLKGLQALAFDLKIGQVGPPVISPEDTGSAYVLNKTKEVPPRELAFQDVTEEVISIIKENRGFALAQEKAEEIKDSPSLQGAAKLSGKKIEKADNLKAGSYINGVGPAKEILSSLTNAAAGEMNEPLIVQNGVLIVQIDSITPADAKEFEEKKSDLKQTLISIKQMELMDAWMRENAGRAKLRNSVSGL